MLFEADAVWREAVCSPSLLCIEWTGSVRPADKEISDWGWEGRFRSDTFCIVERTVCGAMPPAGESVFRDAGGVHAHAKLCSSRDVIFSVRRIFWSEQSFGFPISKRPARCFFRIVETICNHRKCQRRIVVFGMPQKKKIYFYKFAVGIDHVIVDKIVWQQRRVCLKFIF